MPLVFAENELSESDIRYADRTGISYEFPKIYRRMVLSGERFVYYRGRRKLGGGRQPQVYFGTGTVGAVNTATDGERLECDIQDYLAFSQPIPFKKANRYFENGGIRRGYFQRGVRKISDQEFDLIIAENSSGKAILTGDTQNAPGTEHRSRRRMDAIERMALTAAQTAAAANGQSILSRKKRKDILLDPARLRNYITDLLESQKGLCAITGLALEFDEISHDQALLCSLDRIDSSKHYEPGNLQIVCRFVNKWKGAESDIEFRRLVKLLRST